MKKALNAIAIIILFSLSSAAQNQRLTGKMLYHDGPVLTGIRNIYTIYYGCWAENCGFAGDIRTRQVLADFITSIGNSPYAQINSTYTNAAGQPAASSFIFGGEVHDTSYSRGLDLTQDDIVSLISIQVNNFQLPQDPNGIYVIIASADVASAATGFCTPGAPPFHGTGIVNDAVVRYIFLGNPNRCPTVAGPQFSRTGPTPNDSYTADVLVSNFAHALNGVVTNPSGFWPARLWTNVPDGERRARERKTGFSRLSDPAELGERSQSALCYVQVVIIRFCVKVRIRAWIGSVP